MAMKKLIFTILAFASLFILSCQKEDGNTADENNRKDTFSAVVEDGLKTRGDYEISGSTAVFSWTNDDEFYRFVRADNGDGTYGKYNHYTYQYSSGSGSSVEFTGSSVGDGYVDTGFALYPSFKYRTNTNATFSYKNSTDLNFAFNGTITYNSSNPLKNIVPMLGKLDGSTYTFKPLVGVVAVSLTNIPEEANKVVLSTTDKGMLNGYTARFCDKTNELGDYYINLYLGPETHGLRKCWIDGTTKTYSFEANSFAEATFYFPVATSYNSSDVSEPYTNFTVTVKKDDDALVTISKSGISLTVDRGEIVALPTINCNYAGTKVTATATGTPSEIKVYYTKEKGTVTSVRAAAISSKTKSALDTAIPGNTSGTDVFSATDLASAAEVTSGFSASGQYYIGIKAFNGTTEVGSYIITNPVYYLSATDKTNLCQELTILTTGTYGSNSMTNGKMEFAENDDPTEGQIKLVHFDGMANLATNQDMSADHLFFKSTGTWMVSSTYPYAAKKVLEGTEYIGTIINNRLSFPVTTSTPLFRYSVNGNVSQYADVILFSNDADASNAPTELAFTIGDTSITCAHTYIEARWIGYFYNGSTVTNTGGYATKWHSRGVSANYE